MSVFGDKQPEASSPTISPNLFLGEDAETGLVEFAPLPTDQHQSISASLMGYIRGIAGGRSKSTADGNMGESYHSPSEAGMAADPAEDAAEADEEADTDEVDQAERSPELLILTERSLNATIARIKHVLKTGGKDVEQQRQHWASDPGTGSCGKCDEKFSTFKRRHHCRLCGDLFCSTCCNIRLPRDLVPSAAEPVRVCESCHSTTIQFHRTDYAHSLLLNSPSSPPHGSPLNPSSYLCGPAASCLRGGNGGSYDSIDHSTSPHTGGRGSSTLSSTATLYRAGLSPSSMGRGGLAVASCSGEFDPMTGAASSPALVEGPSISGDERPQRTAGGGSGNKYRSGRLSMGFLEANYAGRSRHLSAEESGLGGLGDSGSFEDQADEMLPPYLSREQLQEVHHRAVHGPNRLVGAAHRHRFKTHHNCFLTNDLLNWLMTNNFAANRMEAVGIFKSLTKNNLITCIVSPYPASDQLSTDSGMPFRLVTTSKSASTFSQHPSQPQYSGATSLPPFVRSPSTLDNLTGTDIRTTAGARGGVPASAISRVGFGQQKADVCVEGGMGAVSYSKASDSVRASPACGGAHQDLLLSDDPLFDTVTDSPASCIAGYSPRTPTDSHHSTLSSASSYEVQLGEDLPACLSETARFRKKGYSTLPPNPILNAPASSSQHTASTVTPEEYLTAPSCCPVTIASVHQHEYNTALGSAPVPDASCSPSFSGPSDAAEDDEGKAARNQQLLENLAHNLDACWSGNVERVLQQVLWWCRVEASWAPVLWPLIEHAARVVQPDFRNFDDGMDVRSYVWFKKLPGGSRSECAVVDGLVCSKTVAHRAMSSSLSDPNLLLLADADDLKVSYDIEPFANIKAKETETSRKVVSRVISYRPHLVVAEGSLTSSCFESLQANGYTIVTGVKRSVLNAIARVTRAEVVKDLTTRETLPTLGLCHSFYTRTYNLPTECETNITKLVEMNRRIKQSDYLISSQDDSTVNIENKENVDSAFPADGVGCPSKAISGRTYKKHLMYFTGCPAHLGCTIILRGGSENELRRAKKLMRFMIFVLYNWKFERSYLLQERAMVVLPTARDLASCLSDAEDRDNDESSGREKKVFKSLGTLEGNSEDCKGILKTSAVSNWSSVSLKSSQAVPNSPSRAVEIVTDFSDPLRREVPLASSPRGPSKILLVDESLSSSVAEKNDFRKAMNDVVLWTSPFIKKPMPYLETDVGQASLLRKYFPETLYYSLLLEKSGGSPDHRRTLSDDANVPKSTHAYIPPVYPGPKVDILEPHPYLTRKFLGISDTIVQQLAYSDFMATGGQMQFTPLSDELKEELHHLSLKPWMWNRHRQIPKDDVTAPIIQLKEPPPAQSGWGERGPQKHIDALHLLNHQALPVLFSCRAVNKAVTRYCVHPCQILLEFYGLNDSCLGAFLECYYFSDYKCPVKSGGKCSEMFHERRFHHNNVAVQFSGHQATKGWFQRNSRGLVREPEDKQAIFMWNFCGVCRTTTPLVQMSQITWSFSLAKFLEIWLYGGGSNALSSPSSPSSLQGLPEEGCSPAHYELAKAPSGGAARIPGPGFGSGLVSGFCSHPLHRKKHRQYFYNNDRIIYVTYVDLKVRDMVLPPTPLPVHPPPPTKQEVVDQLKQLVVKGYSVLEGMLEKLPFNDVILRPHFLSQRMQFKALVANIQLQLTSHKLESGQLQPTTSCVPPPVTVATDWGSAAVAPVVSSDSSANAASDEGVASISGPADPAGLSVTGAEDHSPAEVVPGYTDLQATEEMETEAVEKSIVDTCEMPKKSSSDGINGSPNDAMDSDVSTPAATSPGEGTSTKPTTPSSAKSAAAASSSADAVPSVASAAAPVPECSSAGECSVTAKPQIPNETMFIIQDKMIQLHRIVVRAVCYWNQKHGKKEDHIMTDSELMDSTKDSRGRSESDSRRSATTVEQRGSSSSLATTAVCPNPRVVRIGGADNSAGSSRVPSPDVGGAGTVHGLSSSRPSTPLDLRGHGPSSSKQDHESSSSAPTPGPAPVITTPGNRRKAEARSSSRSRRQEEDPRRELEMRLSFIEDTIDELEDKFVKGEARNREFGNIFHPTPEGLVDTADIVEHKPMIKTPTRRIKKSSLEEMVCVNDDGVSVPRDDKRNDRRSVPIHQSANPSSLTEPPEQTSASIHMVEPAVDNSCRPAVGESERDVGPLLLSAEGQTTVKEKSSLAMSPELRQSLDLDSSTAVEHAREASESYVASPTITPRPAVGTAVSVKSFITNLWQSSSSLEIQYPFPTPLHYRGLDELLIPVTVCRDQPASIIAHALASKAYHNSLREKLILSQQYMQQEILSAVEHQRHRGPSASSPPPPTLHTPPDTLITLKWHDHGAFTCKIFFSAEFHLLRRLLLQSGGDEAFIRSLSASADWATKGGKSKSAFCKTLDDRFVLKEMRSTEQEPIDQFCPAYFDYITRAHNRNAPSALARIFGIFSVSYSKSSRTSNTTVVSGTMGQQASAAPRPLTHAGGKVFMVMENLFYGHKVDKIYDLKGNTSNRTTKEGPNVVPGEVFLDCNLLFHRVNTPLLVNPRASYVLPRAIDPDCAFLHLLHIMDYSLLVGLTDGPEPTVIVGIIDYIRKFTHDKFLENLVKETVLRTEDPTIVSPSQYMNRFTRTIPLYFDMVPDAWTGLDLVEPRPRSAVNKKGLKSGGPVGSSRTGLSDQAASGREVIKFQGGTTRSATNHPVCWGWCCYV